MDLLKKIFFSILIAVSMGAFSTVSLAAGKIENATTADVKVAIDEALSSSEEALSTLNNGGSKEDVLALMKKTMQASKKIESNRLDVLRTRTNSKLKKAKSAVKKGQNESAAEIMAEVIKGYQEIKASFAAGF